MSTTRDGNSGRQDSFGEEGKRRKRDCYKPNYRRQDSSRGEVEEPQIDRYMPDYGETVERRQPDRYVPNYDSAAGADDSTTTRQDDSTRPEASARSRDDDNRPDPWLSFRRHRHRSSPDYLTGGFHPSSIPPPPPTPRLSNRRDPLSPPPPYSLDPESASSRIPRPPRTATAAYRDRSERNPAPRSQPSGYAELERSIHRRVYPRRPSRSLSPRSRRGARNVDDQAQAQPQPHHDGSPSSFSSALAAAASAAAAAQTDDSRPPRARPPQRQPPRSHPPGYDDLERSIHRRAYPRRSSRSLSPRSRPGPSRLDDNFLSAMAADVDSRHPPFAAPTRSRRSILNQRLAQQANSPSSPSSASASASASATAATPAPAPAAGETDDSRRHFLNAPGVMTDATNADDPAAALFYHHCAPWRPSPGSPFSPRGSELGLGV